MALRAVFGGWMRCGADELGVQLAAMVLRLRQQDTTDPVERLMLRLSDEYPGDVGIFAPILLNYLQLEPGQAIFLAANEPHAYLFGDIVECMACFDNVVRAGLTPKSRDVDTLCEMLTYRCYDAQQLLVSPRLCGHTAEYSPPCDEFVVTRIDLPGLAGDLPGPGDGPGERMVPQTSPSLLLVTDGAVSLSGLLTARAGDVLLELPGEKNCARPPTTARATGGAPATLFRVFAKGCYGT